MSSPYNGRDDDALYEYRGLFWRRPYLTAVLTVMMLSLAGIPLTAGFIGKFYIIATGDEAHQWWLVGSRVLGGAIGRSEERRVGKAGVRTGKSGWEPTH